ncbi:hypothetical protein J7T55_003438 [Diaporthe amygdali]|uniref:uncharacterized protein n=1 Tax=Phomopsis amygdali TaxID=1214568 RepID=UPI0022FDEEE8|nr:uncharacterized protein J7T55_003438 [Diaporthe amygdali]KAJ0117022.1 hypothetical protein J7T55_003438 [Diaporthe amygdali]
MEPTHFREDPNAITSPDTFFGFGLVPEKESGRGSRQAIVPETDGQPLVDTSAAADGRKKLGGFAIVGLIRWLITALLLMGFVLAVHFYQGKVLDNNDKSIFESIIVTLSLIVGLNIASALKDIAKHMRWWFLSLKRRDLSEVELILQSDSLVNVTKLIWRSSSSVTKMVCLTWLLLNIGMQAAIAVISVTFEAEPHVDDVYLSEQGQVFVPDMSDFARGTGRFQDSRYNQDSTLQNLGASILGDIGSSYNYSVLPSVPLAGEPLAKFPAMFWKTDDYWEYHYLNSAPNTVSAGTNFLAVYSDRKVSSQAVCETPEYNSTIDQARSLLIVNQTSGRNFTFDASAWGLESNTYGTLPILRQLRTDVCGSWVGCSTGECGPGCSTVHVLEPKSGEAVAGSTFDSPTSGFFYYECNITVSSDPPPVSDLDNLTLAPMLAAAAAQAIALNGLSSIDPNVPLSRSFNWQLPFGTPFNNSAPDMANQLARYAIGVVAATASTNPRMAIPGRPPAQGVRLNLEQPVAFAVILGLTAGLQLLLTVVAIMLVGGVYVPGNQEWMSKETLKQLYAY